MNVRIFWVRVMKCMCAQTRPRFILSSERVFGGMECEPMLTPREKSPLPGNFPRGGSNPRRCGQQAQTLPMSYSGPWMKYLTEDTIFQSFTGQSNSLLTIPLVSWLNLAHRTKLLRIQSALCLSAWLIVICKIPIHYHLTLSQQKKKCTLRGIWCDSR